MTTVTPETSFGDKFVSSTLELSPADMKRVYTAVDRFRSDPQHPSLRLKRLHADKSGRLHSIRASADIRILLWREGSLFAFLEAGPRQSIYDRVGNGRSVHNPNTGFIGVISSPAEAEDGSGGAAAVVRLTKDPIDERPGVFDHWAESDLAEAGFDDLAVAALRSCKEEADLLTCGVGEKDFEKAVEIMELTPEQWRSPELVTDENAAEARLRRAIDEFGDAHGLSPFFTPDEVARIAAAPIEEWMIFLHPDQRAVVRRTYEGPARIRGAAGTGKTVVALHRAAELAHRFDNDGHGAPSVLFTTYIKTLPSVFKGLYQRLPNALDEAVEFVHVDKLARRIVNEARIDARIDLRSIDAAFAAALRQVVVPGSPLARATLTDQYLRDEITKVVKGRGIASVDDYLSIDRTGRVVPFSEPMRRQLWDLMSAWDEAMRRRKTVDFADVLLLARDAARARPTPTYRAAIVDEAQDLTLVGLQLVRALVNGGGQDQPDGLLLVGDGAQRIYPGCFTLRQAGIEVTGRSTVLRTNYRNTAEILGAAMAVAGDEAVDDLGDEYQRGDAEAVSIRTGGIRPMLVECADETAEAEFITGRIADLVRDGALGYGDVGIFVPTNKAVTRFMGILGRAGIPRVDLNKLDEMSSDAVKVGTFFRAKGLEFKVVFLPGLDERFPRPPAAGQDATEYDEQHSLAISQLFVAMTRARDALFLISPGSPSPVLVEHLEVFEVLET